MKKIVLGAVAIVAATMTALPASAADLRLPTKAPVVAPPPAFSWQGFYVGASLGGRWADIDWTTTSDVFAGAGGAVATPAQGFGSATLRAGGYVGYNYLVSPNWLIGIEGDGAWGNGSKTNNFIPGISVGGAGDSSFVSHKWDAGIRGRVGVLLTPDWLLFATAGAQWQRVEAGLSCSAATCPVVNFGGFSLGGAFSATDSATLLGWTAGLGIEGRVGGNWIARAEYRYADYGTWNATFAGNGRVIQADIDVQTHTGLAGIAYKF